MTNTDYSKEPLGPTTKGHGGEIVKCIQCGLNGLAHPVHKNAVIHVGGLKNWMSVEIDWCWPTRAYYEAAISDISNQLKGSMSNIERALLVADRKDFRDRLQSLEAEVQQ